MYSGLEWWGNKQIQNMQLLDHSGIIFVVVLLQIAKNFHNFLYGNYQNKKVQYDVFVGSALKEINQPCIIKHRGYVKPLDTTTWIYNIHTILESPLLMNHSHHCKTLSFFAFIQFIHHFFCYTHVALEYTSRLFTIEHFWYLFHTHLMSGLLQVSLHIFVKCLGICFSQITFVNK